MTKVSRAVYQKLSEENKSLKRDIYAMVMKYDQKTFDKWYKHFWKEEQFSSMLKEAAMQYIEDHPEHHWIRNLGTTQP